MNTQIRNKIMEDAEAIFDNGNKEYEDARHYEFTTQLKIYLAEDEEPSEDSLYDFLSDFSFPDEWEYANTEANNRYEESIERRS